MPSSVATLMNVADVEWAGAVLWHSAVPLKEPGVYVVALTDSPDAIDAQPNCPISTHAVQELLYVRPELKLDGRRPTRDELVGRIASMWLSDETILYVGLARTSVAKRVGQYYRTPLGASRPHAGGWPLQALANLGELWVHYAPCPTVEVAERAMLDAFMANVSERASASVCDPNAPLPFANLTIPGGARKRHGITGARESRNADSSAAHRGPRAG